MADQMTFQFMDIGQGDCTLVQMLADGRQWMELALVDCGERGSPFKVGWFDARTYLVNFIAYNSHRRKDGNIIPFVDILFLTHPDKDHYNKLWTLINSEFPGFQKNVKLNFGKVIYGGDKAQYVYTREGEKGERNLIDDIFAERLVLDQFAPANLPANAHYSTDSAAGQANRWRYAKGKVEIYLLSANHPRLGGPKNPLSLVLQFRCGDKVVTLQGDAEEAVETHVQTNFPADFLKSTAMKLGHHGSNAGTSPNWIEALKPQFIFASGDMNWAHPYCGPICRVLNRGYANGPLPIDGWYCCGNLGQYFNNPTHRGVCMNLWYTVQAEEQQLLFGPDKDGNWQGLTAHNVWTWGVQWELKLPATGAPKLACTERVVPVQGATLQPPYDCSTVTETLESSFVIPLLDGA